MYNIFVARRRDKNFPLPIFDHRDALFRDRFTIVEKRGTGVARRAATPSFTIVIERNGVEWFV